MTIRKLEKHEIDSESDSDEETKVTSPVKSCMSMSPGKKAKSILDPIPDPDLNPNLPDLLYKKCRSMRGATSNLGNKVIVRKELDNERPQVVLH